MDAISYSEARATLAKGMEQVCDDHEPFIITRDKRLLRCCFLKITRPSTRLRIFGNLL
jgi:hypothetical protein